eukprot:55246_1
MKFKSGKEFHMNLVTQYCPEPTVSNDIPLTTYYEKAHSMFHQALYFVKQGNDVRSYIELMRYCQLITTLPMHNNYNLKQYEKDNNLNKRRLNNGIYKLEELKPKLIEAYNAEIKQQSSSSLNAHNKDMKWQKRIEELEKTNQNMHRENHLLLEKCENMKQLMDMCFTNKEI